MIQSSDGTYKSITGFGVTSFTTAEAAEADERNFRKWAEGRAGRTITDRESISTIHRDTRSDRERMAGKERRAQLFAPPAPVDARLSEEVVADAVEARAEEARREKMPLYERHALESREKANAARRAADEKAERDRIRATTDFQNVREELNTLRVEIAFDPQANYGLLEEVELQIDLLDTKVDILAGREATKVLKKAARERTENFLSSQRHVDIAKERLDKAYRDLPFDVRFDVSHGSEIARLSDPVTGKMTGLSVAEYEKRTPEQVHRFINDHGYTREEMLARTEAQQ